jgi:hypothetical protein
MRTYVTCLCSLAVFRLMLGLDATNYEAVIVTCGVNISTWTIDSACDNPKSACAPFANPLVPRQKLPLAHRDVSIKLPEGPRKLTLVDAIKGFTGVAYPMKILSRVMIDDMVKYSRQRALDTDISRGFNVERWARSRIRWFL